MLADGELITGRISAYSPRQLVRGPAVRRPTERGRKSAVLILLYPGPDGVRTLVTKRPRHMRTHAGEIAFPGGGIEDADQTMWDTALREANEEIALEPEGIREVGRLDRFVTGASHSLVQPIVAWSDHAPEVTPSPDEVDRIIEVPLRELVDPEAYRSEIWLFEGEEFDMHFFELIGETVWGATALMLHNLLEVVSTST